MKFDSNGNQRGKGKGQIYGKEQQNRLQARRTHLAEGRGDPFDWRTIPQTKLFDCMFLLAKMGGALRIGATRDGGALSVGIYLDGSNWTEYVRPQEDVDAFFDNLLQDFLQEAEARGVDILS